MQDALKSAGEKLGGVLVTFGKNYLSCAVTAGLKPVIIAAINDLLEETKKEVGMKVEEKEDKLGDGKGQEQPDLFGMDLDSVRAIHTGWNYTFTSYTLYCIRVGFSKKGDFYALGAKYEVRYNILTNMYSKLKKEFKDTKVGPVPPDCKHGPYCCCREYKPDMAGSQTVMREYLNNLSKAHPNSKDLPSYFYLGDDYEQQQRSFVIFEAAFAATKAELVKGDYHRDLTPFDEGEALNSLLQAIARQDVIPEIRQHVTKLPGGMCEYTLYHQADMLVLTAIDSAMAAGWPPVQDLVNKGKKQVQDVIDKGADKLVDALKPVLKKILTLVQSKLAGKEEKKEESKKKKTEIGDYISQWAFDKTAIGKRFYDALGDKDAKAALENLKDDFDKAVEETLEEKMKSGLEKIIGDKGASLDIVAAILDAVAKQAVSVLKRFTTIKPLMAASLSLFNVRSKLEKEIVGAKGDQAAAHKAIETASADMWATFPDAGLSLYSKIDKLKDHIKSDNSDLPDEAVEPLLDVADELYNQQMKALNSLRTQFIGGLKHKLDAEALKSEETTLNIIRTSFREIVFSIIHILVVDSWKGIGSSLIQSAIVQATTKFEADVWPAIASGLEEVQKFIPKEVEDLGLKIEPLAKSVAIMLLEKGVRWALNKLVIKLEYVLFEQAGTVLNM
jgi:hypothetical protein